MDTEMKKDFRKIQKTFEEPISYVQFMISLGELLKALYGYLGEPKDIKDRDGRKVLVWNVEFQAEIYILVSLFGEKKCRIDTPPVNELPGGDVTPPEGFSLGGYDEDHSFSVVWRPHEKKVVGGEISEIREATMSLHWRN